MAKIRMIKQFGNVFPYDDVSQGIIHRIPDKKVIDFSYSFPRNPGNHRRFFAFLNIAFDSQDFFENMEALRKWLIIKSGHCKIIVGPDDESIFDPDSIAWDKMDEEEFRIVFGDCVQAFINKFGEIIPSNVLDEVVRF